MAFTQTPEPPDWQSSDKPSASKLNTVKQRAFGASISDITGKPINSFVGKDGFLIPGVELYGVITNTGPGGEADFTDNRYWVTPQMSDPSGDSPSGSGDPSKRAYLTNSNRNLFQKSIMVTNLWEQDAASHVLKTGELVEIELESDVLKPGVVSFARWVMNVKISQLSAFITAVTAINGGIRWRYSIQLGHWDMTTSASTGGTWVDDSGGAAVTAFSAAEDMNTFTSGTGTIGTGNTDVAQTDGTVNGGSCKLVPLPVGGCVVVIQRGTDTTAMPPVTYYTIIGMPNSAQ
jgi:hypothetical protein